MHRVSTTPGNKNDLFPACGLSVTSRPVRHSGRMHIHVARLAKMTHDMTVLLPPLQPPGWVIAVAAISIILFMFSAGTLIAGGSSSRAAPTAERFVGISIMGLLLALTGAFFSSGQTLLTVYLPVLFLSPWAAVAAGVLGLILFQVRKKALHVYAVLELAGACLALATSAFSDAGTAGTRGAALLGAMYFLIRGLDNADRGKLVEKAKKRFADMPARRRWTIGVVGVFSILMFSAVALWAPRYTPPYMIGRFPLPVSAMRCGEVMVVCDAAAWRQRERLDRGSDADRAAAEAAARDRIGEFEHRDAKSPVRH